MLFKDYCRSPGAREACLAVKQAADAAARAQAVKDMAEFFAASGAVREGSVLIPAPQHSGKAEYTKDIAEAVSRMTGAAVADVLKCRPHEPLYEIKRAGRKARLFFWPDGEIPEGKEIFFLDNVIGTGMTFLAARRAIGAPLKPLAYAVDTEKCPWLPGMAW